MDARDDLRPSLVDVSDVEAATAFFEAFSFRPAGTYSDANSLELRLLKRDGRSDAVVLVPKSKGWAFGGCSTVTLLSERVREEARSAVARGATLIVSQRAATVRDASRGRVSSAPSATVQDDTAVDARGTENGERETEAGVACLEGPDGIRVLLIDRRLVGPEVAELPVPRAIAGVATTAAADARVDVRGSKSEGTSTAQEDGARAKREVQVGSSSLPGDALGEAVGGESIARVSSPAAVETRGTGFTGVHPLLLALARLSSRLSAGQRPPRTAASLGADPRGQTSALPNSTERALSDGASGLPSDVTGDWFSEDELREENGLCAPRRTSLCAGANRTQGQSEQALLADGGVAAVSSETAVVAENGQYPLPSAPPLSSPAAECASPGGRGVEGVSETTAVSRGGEVPIATPDAGQGAELMEVERPFPELEVSNLGNLQGSQRITPNSLKPFPIDNEYFKGAALLLMKRKPMDASYAHMFEGKNRMFEVQVQGRFKKIPEGDLYVSLEITEKMQLGLLTKGICRVMLSFGQRMNKRLHYSFGTDDNSELPHIAFPLVSSVNSLVRTPDGEPAPVLGQPFEESEGSRAQRKRMDVGDGFGSFEMGCLYSFSLHSMYINILKWSTCKLPMLRDIDLHTLWGNAALRITAYVMKRKPNGSPGAYRPHLQSDLEYVFCIKVRHVREGEREARSEGGDDAAAEDERANPLSARSATCREGVGEAQRQAGLSLERSPLVRQRRAEEAIAVADRKQAKVDESGREGWSESQTTAMAKLGDGDASDVDSDSGSLGGFATPPESLDGEEDMDSGERGGDGGVVNEDDVRLPAGGTREPVAFSKRSFDQQASAADDRGRDGRQSVDAAAENGDVGARAREGNRRGRGGGTKEMRTSRHSRRAGSDAGDGKMIRRDSWTGGWFLGAGFGANPAVASAKGAEKYFAERASTDGVFRCPAYVDLYARNPKKLQGNWTVFVVVKDGDDDGGVSGGKLWLRSTKNLSIIPAELIVAATGEYSPRLSRRETKRRNFDAALQLLSTPNDTQPNRKHQLVACKLTESESSADKAFRSHNPIPQASSKRLVPAEGSSAAGESFGESGAGAGWAGEKEAEVEPAATVGTGSQGGGETEDSSQDGEATALDGGDLGPFMAGVPAEQTALPEADEGGGAFMNPSLQSSPRRSPERSSSPSETASTGKVHPIEKLERRSSRVWGGRPADLVMEGMVLRVLSEHHLSQQVAVLTSSFISFSRPLRQCLGLPTRAIIHVRVPHVVGDTGDVADAADDANGVPKGEAYVAREADAGFRPSWSQLLIPGFYVVEIHTVDRVYYMLVEGLDEALSWAEAIQAQITPSSQDEVCANNPLCKKSAWKTNVWVMNCRRLELSGGSGQRRGGGGGWSKRDFREGSCRFVEDLLRQALSLGEETTRKELISFLDGVCRLRVLPLEGLSHEEQLCVFLNLYHVMLLHAYFLMGPPSSVFRVASYFTTFCYEVGGDLVSMAELEHSVLRAESSPPRQFVSKLIIPPSEYPFALRKPEPRVNFALNCGSLGTVPCVAIYSPATLESQLEDMSRYYLNTITEVQAAKRTVVLPKMLNWYTDDFPDPSTGSSSPVGCLLRVKEYLVGEKRRQVESLLSEGGSVNVRFGSWSWKCRPVTLVNEDELVKLRDSRI